MKLSFSLNPKPSSSSSTPNPIPPNPNFLHQEEEEDQQTSPEFITEFTPSPTPHPNFTIPPLPNTWNPHPHNPNLESLSVSEDMDLDTRLLKKLREDIKKLPVHKGLEEHADVPVEGFGRAVLAGYGWREGRGIGKNVKEYVKVKEYKGNVGRHGLGFVPKTD